MFLLFSKLLPSKNRSHTGGFGLIELLVSISIMVVVVSIVLVRQSSFNGAVLLRSQAYEIALQLRDVQLSAVSANSQNGVYRSAIGVYFNDNSPNNISYRIFADVDNDGYDATEEFGFQGLLDPRFEIRDIRTTGPGYNTNSGLSVVFQRPNFDALFYDSNGPVAASLVEIDIGRLNGAGTPNDVIRTVEISSAGQIAVQ